MQEAMLHGSGYHADNQDKTKEGQKQRTALQLGSCRSSNGLRVDFDEEYSCGRVTFGPVSCEIGSASAAFRRFSDAAEAPRSSWLLTPGEKGTLQADRQPATDDKANCLASSMCIDLTGDDHDEVDALHQRRAKRKMNDVVFVNEKKTSLKRSQRIANGQVEQIAADRALALKLEREEREAIETGKVAPPPSKNIASGKQIATSKIAQDGWMEDGLLQPKESPAIVNQHVTCRSPANTDAESGAETPSSPILIPSRIDLKTAASNKAKASAEEKAEKEAFKNQMPQMLWSAPDVQSRLGALPTKTSVLSTFPGAWAAPAKTELRPGTKRLRAKLKKEHKIHKPPESARKISKQRLKSLDKGAAQFKLAHEKLCQINMKRGAAPGILVQAPQITNGHCSNDRSMEVDFGSKGIRECFVSNIEHLGCNRNPKPILPVPAAALPRSRLAAASSACRLSAPGGLPAKAPKQLHTTWPAPIPIPHLKSSSLAADMATANLSVAISVPGGPPTLATTKLHTTWPPPPIPVPHLKSSSELDPSTDLKKTGCHSLFAVKSFWQPKRQRNSPSDVFEVPKSAKGAVVC